MDPLNAVVGDAGFVRKFGRKPRACDSETVRIQAHFEALLEDWSHPCLAELAKYSEQARFPRHGAGAVRQRAPLFVDARGTACAVGHLMRATGHAELCADIAAAAPLALVADLVRDAALGPRVEQWAQEVGLSVEQLAQIQPGYSPGAVASLSTISFTGLAIGALGGVVYPAAALVLPCHGPQVLTAFVFAGYAVLGGIAVSLVAYLMLHGYAKTDASWQRSPWSMAVLRMLEPLYLSLSLLNGFFGTGLVWTMLLQLQSGAASTFPSSLPTVLQYVEMAIVGIACVYAIAVLCATQCFVAFLDWREPDIRRLRGELDIDEESMRGVGSSDSS